MMVPGMEAGTMRVIEFPVVLERKVRTLTCKRRCIDGSVRSRYYARGFKFRPYLYRSMFRDVNLASCIPSDGRSIDVAFELRLSPPY
ncbi:hypothetical protein BGZ60DRAFT_420922 [Tricladium varicosporioides]|nr:hypothetical protein BGZ60DRAFT_420922 [Hymenoscyphus varicosporioides]